METMGRLFAVLAVVASGCATLGDPETVTRDDGSDTQPGDDNDDGPGPLPDDDPLPDPDPDPLPDPDPDCTDTPVALLTNGDFEAGPSAWLKSTDYELVVSNDELPVAARSGAYAAWLGGLADGGTQVLAQPIAIPTGATALSVTGHIRIATEDPDPDADLFRVFLISADFEPLEQLARLSNSDANADYAPLALAATNPYPGQTVYLHLQADLDYAANTNFFVDDLAVTATVCQ